LAKPLHHLADAYIKAYQNNSYNDKHNGERWLIRQLAQHDVLHTVFDVGAHRGRWATTVRRFAPQAFLHCFEIYPPNAERLQHALAGDARARCQAIGLAEAQGEMTVHVSAGHGSQTSIYQQPGRDAIEQRSVEVTPGRAYCQTHDIDRIDFLKLDVEGAEHLVLQGFEAMLTPQTIRVIQFEYGRVNVGTRFLLTDFYELLENRGYHVGKLFPKWVDFRAYRWQDEDFLGPNYIAAAPELVGAVIPRGK
jgi:FkbM family methyltransferase